MTKSHAPLYMFFSRRKSREDQGENKGSFSKSFSSFLLSLSLSLSLSLALSQSLNLLLINLEYYVKMRFIREANDVPLLHIGLHGPSIST